MKVLNLRCAHGHLFEGWFASEEDFLDQNGRGLIECPMCADQVITRMPSAPRLNLSQARAQTTPKGGAGTTALTTLPPAAPDGLPTEATLQAMLIQAVRQVLAQTEDVGTRFPEEARRIHHGETEHRAIRGQATPQERAELADEGIEVMSIPMPAGWSGSTH